MGVGLPQLLGLQRLGPSSARELSASNVAKNFSRGGIPGLCLGTDDKLMDIIALGVEWSHGVRVGLEVREFF